jgi:hypothetical protein
VGYIVEEVTTYGKVVEYPVERQGEEIWYIIEWNYKTEGRRISGKQKETLERGFGGR